MKTIYDFAWDEQRDLGVWVATAAGPVCVEAQVRVLEEGEDEEDDIGSPTGEYVLAEGDFPAGAGVLVSGSTVPVWGAPARRAWERLARLCECREQVPANAEQARYMENAS